jgi:hypothetical protein
VQDQKERENTRLLHAPQTLLQPSGHVLHVVLVYVQAAEPEWADGRVSCETLFCFGSNRNNPKHQAVWFCFGLFYATIKILFLILKPNQDELNKLKLADMKINKA